jgi:hypothetical protein
MPKHKRLTLLSRAALTIGVLASGTWSAAAGSGPAVVTAATARVRRSNVGVVSVPHALTGPVDSGSGNDAIPNIDRPGSAADVVATRSVQVSQNTLVGVQRVGLRDFEN